MIQVMTDEEFSDYVQMVNAAYWAEYDEAGLSISDEEELRLELDTALLLSRNK